MIVLFCSVWTSYAQLVVVKVENEPLNKLLLSLSATYEKSISFDDRLLSENIISMEAEFKNMDQALDSILCDYPVAYEKINEVYILYPKKAVPKNLPDSLVISGTIYDHKTFEPLPFSQVLVQQRHRYSNGFGHFAVHQPYNDSVKIAISYLGYRSLDTLLPSNKIKRELEFFLQPSLIQLGEVTVKKQFIPDQPIVGKETGQIKVNREVANYFPRAGDNTVFRFLELMPGIQISASGGNAISIWGSDPNRTEYDFDGVRIYNSEHFYGNIGVINPLSIKDVQVTKGAASSENTTSNFGKVQMIGKAGNRVKPSFTAELNNLTTNLLFETPAGARNTFLISARAMYRNPENTVFYRQLSEETISPPHEDDIFNSLGAVSSDYLFGDIHMKLSGAIGSTQNYYIALYQSYDESDMASDSSAGNNLSYAEMNKRWGNSGLVGYFNRRVNDRYSFEIKTSLASNFESNNSELQFYNEFEIDESGTGRKQLWDYSFQNINNFNWYNHHVKTGGGVNLYMIRNEQTNNDTLTLDRYNSTLLPYLFAQDNFYVDNNITLNFGGRLVYSTLSKNLSFSPNLSLIGYLSDHWSVGGNLGRTHNHILKVRSIFGMDIENGSRYWRIADGNEIKIERTDLVSTSVNFNSRYFQVTIEGYYKKINGLNELGSSQLNQQFAPEKRSVPDRVETSYFSGDANIIGFSCYGSFQKGNFMTWISYNFNNGEKQIDGLYNDEIVDFGYNHQHEMKTAAIMKIGRFVGSSSLNYGSGYQWIENAKIDRPIIDQFRQRPYFRWDASLVYRSNWVKMNYEAGVSVMNITNYKNSRYQNLGYGLKPPSATSNIYYEISSLPRTLSAFLKIKI